MRSDGGTEEDLGRNTVPFSLLRNNENCLPHLFLLSVGQHLVMNRIQQSAMPCKRFQLLPSFYKTKGIIPPS
jgi:hypothetical protein